MFHGCGLSNGGSPHLKPYIAPSVTFPMSDVIRLDLKPTVVAARTLVEQEYRLYLGLLSMPCSPEGDGYVELDLPGYSRQAVDFFGEPGRVLLGLSSVRFAFDNEMPVHVQQVAAFDQQLIFLNPLRMLRQ